MEYSENQIKCIVEAQRRFFLSDKTLDVEFRIRQLKRLRAAVILHEDDLKAALAADPVFSSFSVP